MNLNEIFARNIRKRRASLGFSQEELGERSDLTRNYIGMIERCENSPTLEAVEAIAKALETRAADLLAK